MMQYLIEGFVEVGRVFWPTLRVILLLSPIWLPIVLVPHAWRAWIGYRRTKYIASKEPTLLEVRIPKEVSKSPLAMETALGAFWNPGGEKTLKDRYWKGGVRPWFSLELVSLEGRVKFFIWTWKDNIKGIQNALYAQYPLIEVVEVPDYTLAFIYDEDRADIHAMEYKLAKPDPYPIKTYVDYGLDRDPKEEFKTDPITPVLEYLGGLGKGEQAWIQIIIRAHKDEDKKKGGIFGGIKSPGDLLEIVPKMLDQLKKTDNWKDGVAEEVEKIVKNRKIKEEEAADDEGGSKRVNLTAVEKDMITALERSVTKPGFDVGIRSIYLAERDVFNPAHKGALGSMLAQYSTQHLNGFRPGISTSFDYWFQDPFGKKLPAMKREMFAAYRERGYFHGSYAEKKLGSVKDLWERKKFILNTEELATIYHFPGGVAQTPTFGRIDSRKAEPPSNLPI